MSCCGGKRALLRQSAAGSPAASGLPRVVLEYVGTAGRIEIGPATGVKYRFGWRGVRVSVDARDAAIFLAQHGDLRRL